MNSGPHALQTATVPPCRPNRWQSLVRILEQPGLLGLFILGLSVAVRVGELDAMVNVDMYLFWGRRVAKFMQGIATGEFEQTCQSHHPGVTFMWLVGLLWKAYGTVDATLDPAKLRLAVLPVLTIGSLFPLACFATMLRLLGRARIHVASMVALLFATEPLFVAHSRNAHLDVMVTSFAWVAVLSALVARRERSLGWAATSGALLGLALLTKLSAAGYALGIAMVFGVSCLLGKGQRWRSLGLLALIVVVSSTVIVACWPALWVSPSMVIERLHQGLTNEVDKVGPFMFLGKTGKLDLPFWIYGVFLVYLVTPEFFLPGVALLFSARRLDARTRSFAFDALSASLPLVILVLRSNHVGNRYLIPMLPCVGTLAGVAMAQFGAWLYREQRPKWLRLALVCGLPVLVIIRVARLAALYPLPITYCSSWTGTDCSAMFHTGWGEGMKEAARFAASTAQARTYTEKLTIYGGAYASTMSVWTPLKTTKDLSQAHLLVQYLPDQQREVPVARAVAEYVRENQLLPLHEVKLNGRTYVTLYPGPRY